MEWLSAVFAFFLEGMFFEMPINLQFSRHKSRQKWGSLSISAGKVVQYNLQAV